MSERLTLTNKEVLRIRACELVIAGQLTVVQAATALRISERQCWRIMARYREQGAAGLAHGNRGRACPRRLSEKTRKQILALAKTKYADYNDQHLTEELNEEHGIHVSVASVRRLRRGAGLASPRKYRRRRGHQRRARYEQLGMLLQLDASPYDWLEGRGPKLTLVGAIDDATSQIVAAVFRRQEDAAGYYLILQSTARQYGLPLAVYADRHTIFQSPVKLTVEQQLLGQQAKTHFSRLLAALGVELIAAHSPQAKGRIERLWLTLQDRLVKELRKAGASTIEQANEVLVAYLPKFNQRFGVQPAQPGSAFRPLPADLDLDLAFAFSYQRQVANDHTISFAGHKLQLPATVNGRSYAKAQVQLRHAMDGRLHVLYQNHLLISFLPAQPGAPRPDRFSPQTPATLPARPALPQPAAQPAAQRQPNRPAANHPWRRAFKPQPAAEAPPLTPAPSAQPDIFTDRLT